jgi:hypothetical protein
MLRCMSYVICAPDRTSGVVLRPDFRAQEARDEAVLCRRVAHRGFITVVGEVCHWVHLHLGSRETEDERRLHDLPTEVFLTC